MPHPPLGNPAAIPPKLQRRLDRNTRHPRSPNHGDRWIQTIEESATVVLGSAVHVKGRDIRAERASSARADQRSTCSAIERASSTSMPRYLTVLSILVWPSNSCTARRLPVRRWINVAFVRLREWVPK